MHKVAEFIKDNNVQVMFFSEVRFEKEQETTKLTYENMAEQMVDYLSTQGLTCY